MIQLIINNGLHHLLDCIIHLMSILKARNNIWQKHTKTNLKLQ